MSRASAVAWTSSTARATMLRYGLRRMDSSAPARVERLPRERVELVVVEHDARRRPEQVRQVVAAARLERVGPRHLDLVERLAPACGARSRPSFETIRPSFSGYSVGWCSGDEARLALERRRLQARRRCRRSPGRGGAPSSSSGRRRAARFRRGTRDKPPTRTLTGWIAPAAEHGRGGGCRSS